MPDEGPLTDYEGWMPDFMSGLAKGIEKSRGMVRKAVSGVASDLMLRPQAAVREMQGGGDVAAGDPSVGELLGGLREMLSGLRGMAGRGRPPRKSKSHTEERKSSVLRGAEGGNLWRSYSI